jgi:hypothetical protein
MNIHCHACTRSVGRETAKVEVFLCDAVFMHVPNVNYSIFSCGNENEKYEILFLEMID